MTTICKKTKDGNMLIDMKTFKTFYESHHDLCWLLEGIKILMDTINDNVSSTFICSNAVKDEIERLYRKVIYHD